MDPIEFDNVPDIRLIVCDMDGTLLDDDNALHDDFWPVIDQLHQRGVTFCPGKAWPINAGKSPKPTIGEPSTLRTTSPGSRPALAAGPFFSTLATKAPSGLTVGVVIGSKVDWNDALPMIENIVF